MLNPPKNLRNVRKAERSARMSDVAMAQELMQEAFPPSRYGNVKASIWAAYRSLKLATERRAETIWYGTARRIEAAEMDALRLERAKQEARANAIRLHQTAAFLRHQDADFHRDTIAALECAASSIGTDDSA